MLDVRDTEIMRRSFRTRRMLPGGFPGLAPWAGMRCPVRAWDWKRSGGPVSGIRWAQGIGNTVGTTVWKRRGGPLYRKRDRSICPEWASHTSPGQRPGNRIRENRCVLKEHRIGSLVLDVRDTEIMRRSFRTRRMLPGGFPGLAPWAGMRCPLRA